MTPWTAACQASLSITNSSSLLKLMSIESVMPSNHLILCRPLLLLPSIFPSLRVFSHAAAAAKSLQLCPTLCNPRDGSPPGSSVPGILQARILEWVAISLSNAWKCKVKVKSLSRARLLATPWTAAYQASPLMGFSRQKYWSGVPLPSPLFPWAGGQSIGASASASVLPMNIQDWFPLGLDWLDLLAVQGTLKSLLQHHSSKVSILWHSAFFIVYLSHTYMTTGKTIALTRRTFVSKVMSLLFNMLSRLVITFLPGSKRLLISWLQSHLIFTTITVFFLPITTDPSYWDHLPVCSFYLTNVQQATIIRIFSCLILLITSQLLLGR